MFDKGELYWSLIFLGEVSWFRYDVWKLGFLVRLIFMMIFSGLFWIFGNPLGFGLGSVLFGSSNFRVWQMET